MRLVSGSGGIVLLSGYWCDSRMQWITHLWLCLLTYNCFNLQPGTTFYWNEHTVSGPRKALFIVSINVFHKSCKRMYATYVHWFPIGWISNKLRVSRSLSLGRLKVITLILASTQTTNLDELFIIIPYLQNISLCLGDCEQQLMLIGDKSCTHTVQSFVLSEGRYTYTLVTCRPCNILANTLISSFKTKFVRIE